MAKRKKTRFPGVYEVDCTTQGKADVAFYIKYPREGKNTEEQVGRKYRDAMTASQANLIRADRLRGKAETNQERREKDRAAKIPQWTFQNLWKAYLEHKGNYPNQPTDRSLFTSYLKPLVGDKQPGELQPLDVSRIDQKLRKKLGRSNQTAKHTIALLVRLSNFGLKQNLCPPIPFHVELPKVNVRKEEDLSPMQIKRLLEVLEQEDPLNPVAWLMKFMLFTGRRTGELCKLRWEDLDLLEQRMLLRSTKAGRDEYVPFSDHAKRVLEQMPRFSDEWVFPNSNGKPRKSVRRSSNRIKELAGLPDDYRPTYCLRHTFASVASSLEIQDQFLKRLTGHSATARGVIDHYSHISREKLLEIANRIGAKIISFQSEAVGTETR